MRDGVVSLCLLCLQKVRDETLYSCLSYCHEIEVKFEMLSFLGPIVQSIVNLTISLRGQLVKCFTAL